MKAYVFPGQGAQFEGMGKDLYTSNENAKNLFDKADSILGYALSEIMFEGSSEDLKATKVTQPALFVHAIATHAAHNLDEPNAVAGHSLGEFTALVINKCLTFEDGLKLVYERAMAMQEACITNPGTMAAILGLEDQIVESICADHSGVVVPANYNCPGQLVISGEIDSIKQILPIMTEAGAKRALQLEVGGAFHSPLMESARQRLKDAIMTTNFSRPICPIYQNVTSKAENDPEQIKENLISQLTGAVKWTQTIQNMFSDGICQFMEIGGNGKVLSGLIKKIHREAEILSL